MTRGGIDFEVAGKLGSVIRDEIHMGIGLPSKENYI